MDGIEAELHEALADLRPRASRVPFVSTVTGNVIEGATLDAAYWWRNVREPVRFAEATGCAQALGAAVFVEVGPHAILRGYLNDNTRGGQRPSRVVVTSVRGRGGVEDVARAAAEVLLTGAPVDLKPWFPHPGQLASLPNYPWQREPHRIAPTPESLGTLDRRLVHPLLGYRLHGHEQAWENALDAVAMPWLADHVVGGGVVFPAAGHADLALAAAAQWLGAALPLEVEDLEVRVPLVLAGDASRRMRVILDPADGGFSVRTRELGSSEEWTVHAVGRILASPRATPRSGSGFVPPERAADFDAATHYDEARQLGLDYGPAFRAIDCGWTDGETVIGRLRADAVPTEGFLLPPALLDAAFQLLARLVPRGEAERDAVAYVPVRLGRLVLTGTTTALWARATLARRSSQSLSARVELFDAAGGAVALVEGLRLRRVPLRRTASEHVDWIECVGVPAPAADVAGEPADAQAAVESLHEVARRLSAGGCVRRYAEEVEPLLEALCASYAERALRELADANGFISRERLAESVAGRPRAGRVVELLLAHLDADGVLGADEAGWRFVAAEPLPPPESIWNTLLGDHPAHAAIFHAVGRIGLHLERALAHPGGADLPERLAPAGFAALGDVFGPDGLAALQQGLSAIAGAMLRARGEGARLRLLEIGTGAPLLLRALAAALPADRFALEFATASREAAERVAAHVDDGPEVCVRVFGGDESPEPPGGQGGAHMAIVVVEPADMAASRAMAVEARALLAPGGTLVLLDLPESRWTALVGASGEGAASDGAEAGPDGAGWREWLGARGFEDTECIPFIEGAEGAAAPRAFVARAEGTRAAARVPASGGWWLAAEPSAPGEALRERIEALGSPVLLGRPDEGEPVARALSAAGGLVAPLGGVVLLAGFEPDAAGAVERAAAACRWLADLARAAEQGRRRVACWVVTAGAARSLLPGRSLEFSGLAGAALQGFARSLANEATALDLRLVDLEPGAAGGITPAALDGLMLELAAPDAEREVVIAASGARFAPRLRLARKEAAGGEALADDSTLRLGFAWPGQLRNLRWEVAGRTAPGAGEIEIEVATTGLNFRDVMYALGLLPDEAVETGFAGPNLGLECAGYVTRVGEGVRDVVPGERVVAFGRACFARHVTTPASAAARVPEGLSFEAAATIASTFFTAYYAIHELARLKPGERILVHGAAGGVGIATIQLARHVGAEIYATAGSDEKRDFLRLMGVDRIFDSRSLAFADEVLAATAGEGVDVILNSLAGEAINRNLGILKPFGRLLELGKRDFYENTRIGLRPFRNNIAYFGIDADQLMVEQPALATRLFRDVMALFETGELHPLPFRAFDANEVVDAFRHMQQARQVGKVVITYREGIRNALPPPSRLAALRFDPAAPWLVTGGLSGFGLRTARWLARKGVRRLVLVGRRGEAGAEEGALEAFAAEGVQVLARACDVGDREALAALLEELGREAPPLGGIVHAAAVIEDGLARNLDPGALRRVLDAKARGAWNLHALTRDRPPAHFILYSSATTLFGNPGQSAYVAANAFVEALAEARRAEGLPALCVRWGAIEDAGYLARHPEMRKAFVGRLGGAALRADDALNVLERLLADDRSGLGVIDIDWRALARYLPAGSQPRYAEFARRSAGTEAAGFDAVDLERMLAELGPEELTAAIGQLLRTEIGQILGIPRRPDRRLALARRHGARFPDGRGACARDRDPLRHPAAGHAPGREPDARAAHRSRGRDRARRRRVGGARAGSGDGRGRSPSWPPSTRSRWTPRPSRSSPASSTAGRPPSRRGGSSRERAQESGRPPGAREGDAHPARARAAPAGSGRGGGEPGAGCGRRGGVARVLGALRPAPGVPADPDHQRGGGATRRGEPFLPCARGSRGRHHGHRRAHLRQLRQLQLSRSLRASGGERGREGGDRPLWHVGVGEPRRLWRAASAPRARRARSRRPTASTARWRW